MAGSLKRELQTKYGIKPKMKHLYHELDVLVNGKRVYSYREAQHMPTVQEMMAAVEAAANGEAAVHAGTERLP